MRNNSITTPGKEIPMTFCNNREPDPLGRYKNINTNILISDMGGQSINNIYNYFSNKNESINFPQIDGMYICNG